MRVGDGSVRDGALTIEGREKTVRASASAETPGREKAPLAAEDGPSPFAQVLRGLGREMDRGEALVKGAVRGAGQGQELGNGQLLALQAGVYRYSEAVDLSAKLVDRATNGVKTVLQGQ